jgi:DNA primase small subunit
LALSKENIKFVRELLSHYYKIAPIRLPKDLGSREFAFQTLDSEVYVRHMSFSSDTEVRTHLILNTPKQAYYSTAKYLNPAAPDFSEAMWQGSELMFDIDSDKLPGCQTLSISETAEVITDSCIEAAKKSLERLVYILEHHMGFSKEELMVYFSGNRGFHVVVATEDPEWLGLGSTHRLEIVDYITARGIDIKRVSGMVPRKNVKPLRPNPNDGGWRSLIAEFGEGSEVSDEVVKKIAVAVDPVVTQDISRLVRIPNSINGKSGLPARLLKVDNISEFRLDSSLSPYDGYAIVKPKVNFEGSLIGREVRLVKDVATRVDLDIALYLVLNDLASIFRYSLNHVRRLDEYYR